MSPSVGHRSPIRRDSRSKSPVRARSSRRSPKSDRERSPHRSSHRDRDRNKDSNRERVRSPPPAKEREKERPSSSSRIRSPKRPRSRSPAVAREHKHSREEHHKERHREREVPDDRSSERRSSRVKKEGESSLRSRSKQSMSPTDRDHAIRPTSGSPSRNSRSRASHNEIASPRRDEHRDEKDSVAIMMATEEALTAKKKEEPSFELSGKLAAETNRVKGVTLLFNEPPDARKPDIRWRLYVFKAGEALNEPLYIHRQTCYLFGRERRVADVPTDHPSCSKQHAVIQFRQVEKERSDGMLAKQSRICGFARELSGLVLLPISFTVAQLINWVFQIISWAFTIHCWIYLSIFKVFESSSTLDAFHGLYTQILIKILYSTPKRRHISWGRSVLCLVDRVDFHQDKLNFHYFHF